MADAEKNEAGGFPDINYLISPEVPYKPETISVKALWPIVDERWGGDFRKEGEPNMPAFSMPRAGFYNNRFYEVVLKAETDHDQFEEEDVAGNMITDTLTAHTITLQIEELCPEQTSAMIDMALGEDVESLETYLGDGNDSREHELRAMAGVRYVFDSDGDFYISPYIVLRNLDKTPLWSKGDFVDYDGAQYIDTDDDEEPTDADDAFLKMTPQFEGGLGLTAPSLNDEDIRKLMIAAVVLKAPRSVVEYLRHIVTYPEHQ